MKKILLLILVLCLCACSSNKQDTQNESLTIVTPQGAPVLAFYDQIDNENYTRVSANAISALWSGDKSPDVLVCDITSGIQAIDQGAQYKLGAIITFGNLYIGSTGNDNDNQLSKDDTIVLFGNENMMPNRVWHYLYGDEYDSCLVFENSATEAARALTSGKNSEGKDVDYVFLAQPALFACLKNNEKASIYVDVQKEYQEKSNSMFVQAAVFVKNSLSDKQIDRFLNDLKDSVNKGIENPELVAQGLSAYEGDEAMVQYGFNPNVVLNVFKQKNAIGINAMGLGFEKAIDVKKDIDQMMSVFGFDNTNEEIYIK